MSIQHIEDLPQSKLDSLIQNWNDKRVTITEKVDGSYMTFGLKDGNFFLGSKNLNFTRFDNIPNIFFYDEFRKYFKIIYYLPIENILSGLERKYKLSLPRTFEGEAIPSSEHNIICYDLNKIRNGVFVFFKTFEKNNNELWNDLVEQLNVFSVIKFHVLPKITTEISLNKNNNIKHDILSKLKFSPLFGENYEGIVVEFNNEFVKIIDKEKFNKIKQINWTFINAATKYKLQFKTKTKKDVSKIKENLEIWLLDLNELEKKFKTEGYKTLTIKKKKSDTLKYIEFCRKDIILPLFEKINEETPEQVFNRFLNKNYSDPVKPVKQKDHTTIFKNTNSCIPKNLIKTNIEQTLEDIKLKNLKYNIVGNNDSNYIGDLDVAISKQDIVNKINSKEDFWKDINNHLKSIEVDSYVLKGLRQFHISTPLRNDNKKELHAINRNGKELNMPGLIQVDFFVGNMKWMETILSGKPKESEYKASYRNVLLRSIISSLRWQNKNNFCYGSIEWKDGIKINTSKISEPKTKKEHTNKEERIKEKIIIEDSNQLARFLFGRNTTWSQINSFEKLFNLYQSKQFRFNKFRHIINQAIIINYVESNMQVPEIINSLFIT